ncbi:MAG: hypothetical protein BZY81_00015 [SAR202 cluster bacterium Io17-Chloro-G4]|nr:MAG: hypothetical protein BZY81_00015 [SAR202 cluster bacterium Io17-Chloro-G4]
MPRRVGDWTLDKLKILDQYLPAYLSATQKATERIYIDAFAGPGQNLLNRSDRVIDGSPLIALDASGPKGTIFDRLFFIEDDPEAASELNQLLSSHDKTNRAKVIPGEVNQKLPELMAKLPKRSPTFIFIDPEGIDPRWSTIEALVPWRTEFLINFPLGMSIKRNLTSRKIVDYFGTQDVDILLKQAVGKIDRPLLDFYKNRLRTIGYGYQVEDERLVKTSNNQSLYYLIFAGKN